MTAECIPVRRTSTAASRVLPLLMQLAVPLTASAAPTAYPQHFLEAQAPDLMNARLAPKTRELCYSGYARDGSSICVA